MSIRLMLVDDHRMFREALVSQLMAMPDIDIVAEASTGAEALERVAQNLPDILVLDIALPDITGIEVARRVFDSHPEIRIVALSGYADPVYVQAILKAGASAYVVKSGGIADLLCAIQAVVSGHTFLSPEITDLIVLGSHEHSAANAPPATVLTPRERDVLRLLSDGKRSAEIGTALGISPATVDVHRRNIREKLSNVTSRP